MMINATQVKRAAFSVALAVLLLVLPMAGAQSDRPDGWTDASHSNKVEPDYVTVFPEDKVNEITITIAAAQWEVMQANMAELMGQRSRGGMQGGLPGRGGVPGAGDPGGGLVGGGSLLAENPMWVEATIEFEGQTWNNVGLRYKGNSTLTTAYSSGSLKLPMKLDFDEWEDDYPEIKNQRFFGFKQLSFSNAVADASYLRDTLAYDLIETAGLAAAQTAFYRVVLDYGQGPVDLGIYVVTEVIDDTVIPQYFGSDDGNIYEGEGTAASFAAGTRSAIEESFQKENNKSGDWSDIEALYDALHSDLRTSRPEIWREQLEAVFDTDTFLRWLALTATMQNWDAYGGMAHNYYLYNDPDSGKLTWVAWDHDRILSGGGPGGAFEGMVPTGAEAGANGSPAGFPGAQGGGGANRQPPGVPGGFAAPGRAGGFAGRFGYTSLDHASTTDSWPLIRFLLDDPVYAAVYQDQLADIAANVFKVDQIVAANGVYLELLEPYFSGSALESLRAAAAALNEHVVAAGEALTTHVTAIQAASD